MAVIRKKYGRTKSGRIRGNSRNPTEPSSTRYSFLASANILRQWHYPVAALRAEGDKNVNHRRVSVIGGNINRVNKKSHFEQPLLKAVATTFATDADLRAPDGELIKGRAAIENFYVALFAERFEDAKVTVASPADN